MAKETIPGSSIADRVTVTHLATHEATPSVGNVLLSGVRVAYIFYSVGYPLSFLPRDMHKLKLTAAELRDIQAAAQDKVKPIAEEVAKEQSELKAFGV